MTKFQMRVDLSILDSLGINLYSNAAAVLSELVANAYDADATSINIQWDTGSVVVTDNGCGMTAAQLNDRFLKVGYRKRDNEGATSPRWHRRYMGRKGIGKLSVFSIANDVAVYSTTEDDCNGFSISVPDLRVAIEKGRVYQPREVSVPAEYQTQGTTLVLSDLRTKRADLTAVALRKRLARRFDVLDQTPPAEGGFAICVNGDRITWEDRQELKKLQFIWEFGNSGLEVKHLPANIVRFNLDNVVDATKEWTINGWFGTAGKPTDLTDDVDAGSLKNIIILARKRPIQEGIIEKLDFSRVFGNYVTGQIEADFLDLDDEDDIATSDRQRLIEDDSRVVALQTFLREAFKRASDEWSKNRPSRMGKDALIGYPKIRTWIDGLDEYQKSAAESMIGTIAAIEFDGAEPEMKKKELFRSGILAFERIGLRKAVEDLEALSNINAEQILPLLGQQSDYEAGLWTDILRSRVEAISTFESLTQEDEKERVLQAHLFENLWLLDPSWERASKSDRMEQSLRRMAKDDFDVDISTKEKIGRIDIRYSTAAGRHVIVELKRYGVRASAEDLAEQGRRYAVALKKALAELNRESEPIEVVFVLGQHPRVANESLLAPDIQIEKLFESCNGRYVLYNELIHNALGQYEDYLNASARARSLEDLLNSI